MERKPTFRRAKAVKKHVYKKIKKESIAPRFVIRGKKLDDEEVTYNKAYALNSRARMKSQRRLRVTDMKAFHKRRAKNKVARKQRALNKKTT